jgi:hypothetical protein
MPDWQHNFASATTGVAFALTLTMNHVTCLQAVSLGQYHHWQSASGRSLFVPMVDGLIRRGLVEHNPAVKEKLPPGVKPRWVYRLTPAGEHILALLNIAGLLPVTATEAAA